MPVRNAGDYLKQAVTSILLQTHTKIKLLIVDDHSTDAAIEQLTPNPRIKVLKNPGNGIVSALNHGLEHAIAEVDCEYIARMDADDIAHPQRLEKQLAYQKNNPDIDIIGTKVKMFGNSLGDGYRHYEEWINGLTKPEEISLNIYVESPIPHPTAFAHKKIWRKLGGYLDHGWPEDYDLWLRAHLQKMRFGKPQEVLLDWRDHKSRLSRQENRYAKKSFYHAKIYYFTKQSIAKQVRIWGTGPTAMLVHDQLAKHDVTTINFIDISEKMIGRKKRNKNVVSGWGLIKTTEFLLVAVAARGARDEIRDYLKSQGFSEGQDYLCVA